MTLYSLDHLNMSIFTMLLNALEVCMLAEKHECIISLNIEDTHYKIQVTLPSQHVFRKIEPISTFYFSNPTNIYSTSD